MQVISVPMEGLNNSHRGSKRKHSGDHWKARKDLKHETADIQAFPQQADTLDTFQKKKRRKEEKLEKNCDDYSILASVQLQDITNDNLGGELISRKKKKKLINRESTEKNFDGKEANEGAQDFKKNNVEEKLISRKTKKKPKHKDESTEFRSSSVQYFETNNVEDNLISRKTKKKAKHQNEITESLTTALENNFSNEVQKKKNTIEEANEGVQDFKTTNVDEKLISRKTKKKSKHKVESTELSLSTVQDLETNNVEENLIPRKTKKKSKHKDENTESLASALENNFSNELQKKKNNTVEEPTEAVVQHFKTTNVDEKLISRKTKKKSKHKDESTELSLTTVQDLKTNNVEENLIPRKTKKKSKHKDENRESLASALENNFSNELQKKKNNTVEEPTEAVQHFKTTNVDEKLISKKIKKKSKHKDENTESLASALENNFSNEVEKKKKNTIAEATEGVQDFKTTNVDEKLISRKTKKKSKHKDENTESLASALENNFSNEVQKKKKNTIEESTEAVQVFKTTNVDEKLISRKIKKKSKHKDENTESLASALENNFSNEVQKKKKNTVEEATEVAQDFETSNVDVKLISRKTKKKSKQKDENRELSLNTVENDNFSDQIFQKLPATFPTLNISQQELEKAITEYFGKENDFNYGRQSKTPSYDLVFGEEKTLGQTMDIILREKNKKQTKHLQEGPSHNLTFSEVVNANEESPHQSSPLFDVLKKSKNKSDKLNKNKAMEEHANVLPEVPHYSHSLEKDAINNGILLCNENTTDLHLLGPPKKNKKKPKKLSESQSETLDESNAELQNTEKFDPNLEHSTKKRKNKNIVQSFEQSNELSLLPEELHSNKKKSKCWNKSQSKVDLESDAQSQQIETSFDDSTKSKKKKKKSRDNCETSEIVTDTDVNMSSTNDLNYSSQKKKKKSHSVNSELLQNQKSDNSLSKEQSNQLKLVEYQDINDLLELNYSDESSQFEVSQLSKKKKLKQVDISHFFGKKSDNLRTKGLEEDEFGNAEKSSKQKKKKSGHTENEKSSEQDKQNDEHNVDDSMESLFNTSKGLGQDQSSNTEKSSKQKKKKSRHTQNEDKQNDKHKVNDSMESLCHTNTPKRKQLNHSNDLNESQELEHDKSLQEKSTKKKKKSTSTIKDEEESEDSSLLDFADSSFAKNSSNIMFKGLTIITPWEVPPAHLIETRMSSTPTKAQREKFEKLPFKLKIGKFSEQEDQIIKNNWNRFCEAYRIQSDPQPFLNLGTALDQQDRINFVRYLAKGIENRMLNRIYCRFQTLYRNCKEGCFSKEEDEAILEIMNVSRSNHKFVEIGNELNRSRFSIERRFQKLVQYQKFQLHEKLEHTHGAQKRPQWSIERIQEFLTVLQEVTLTADIDELRNREILKEEWETISLQLNCSVEQLKVLWNFKVYPQLFIECPLSGKEMVELIVRRLHKSDVTWKTADWKAIAEKVPGLTALRVYRCFNNFVKDKVPKELHGNLKDCVNYLMTNYVKVDATGAFKMIKKFKFEDGNLTVIDK